MIGLAGDRINVTENRAVLHTALRAPKDAVITVDGDNVVPEVHAVLEAMAAALPVVTTNVGGVPDLIRHGHSGFVFEPQDEDGMVAALLALCLKMPTDNGSTHSHRHGGE